ncbi:methyl-accepting chemotaxis protein [Hydrogenophaga sp. PAMC20947]|uniref:methyl-accepting chemotaxis protein n=1 Tax=Hydrogenophaga sp. PAMC20947 TaxID=2565558 RepID=UPI00109DBBBD|nr:methyl-accepting chemotaxis protein [Hydrogenophaga sp. PAMC20947]QCB47707.1 HAMP domain-containing protein [Hydrogenophaga sp. PAMC20947]
MIFDRLKIGQRLYLGFAVVLMLLAVMTALAFVGLQASQAATQRIVEMDKRSINTSEWLQGTKLNINRVLAVAKSGNDPAVDAYFKPLMAETSARISEVQKSLEAEIVSEQGKALLVSIAAARSDYIAVRKAYFAKLSADDLAGAEQVLNNALMPAANRYSGLQESLLTLQQGLVSVAVQDSESTIQRQVLLLATVAGFTLLFALWVAWSITRSVTKPVGEALQMANAVAQGDLTRSVVTRRQDELGDLIRALAAMKDSLLQTVTQVRSATDSINTASAEIASGNQDLSARTEQAASNLEETAASMEQLTSTVRQSADAARQANQLAATASEIAVRGGQVVGEVVTTMEAINHSSKKISDIISVIDGIAFQTNILALNAAVEAARAGEQGRGFAVVASEVRSLAQRSAEAAKEIKGLIGTSVDKVEAGSRLVADAGQTMSEIVGSVQRVSDIIGEITAAAGEQSDGIGQVNVAVNQLDQMTQQNAALVEESAAAAESLKEQALRLAQVIQVFRLDSEVGALIPAPVRKLSPARKLAPAMLPRAAGPALGSAYAKPSLELKRPAPASTAPTVRSKTASQPAASPSTKAQAPAGAEGDWESF